MWCLNRADEALSVKLEHLDRTRCLGIGVSGTCLAPMEDGRAAERPRFVIGQIYPEDDDDDEEVSLAVAREKRRLREMHTGELCEVCVSEAVKDVPGAFVVDVRPSHPLCWGPGGRDDPQSFCLRKGGHGCSAGFALADVSGSTDLAAIEAEYRRLNVGPPQVRLIFCKCCAVQAAREDGGTKFPMALYGKGDPRPAIEVAKKEAAKVAERLAAAKVVHVTALLGEAADYVAESNDPSRCCICWSRCAPVPGSGHLVCRGCFERASATPL